MKSFVLVITFIIIIIVIIFIIFYKRKLSFSLSPQCSYSEKVKNFSFKSGDIIISSGICLPYILQTPWTHVALVYQNPLNGVLYVWDTRAPTGIIHAFTHSLKQKATRLTPLFRYLDKCIKPICVRRINGEVDVTKFTEFIEQKWNQSFGFDYLHHASNRIFMNLVGVPLLKGRKGRYCAELISETLAYLGVLNFQRVQNPLLKPRTILPRDFTFENENLPFETGWSFGPEILLEF